MIGPWTLVRTAVGVGLAGVLVRQCRRPFGFPGRMMARSMNRGHRALTAWGLEHVDVGEGFAILDVGCGGGQTIAELATRAPRGKVSGVDYSEASVATTREVNARAISEDRVDIREASVSALPFKTGTFDLVTAIETHYYWPDFVADLREVLRVLKPGGSLVLIAETYRGRSFDWLFRPAMRLLGATSYLTPVEHQDALTRAGYADVRTDVERSRGWICAVGRKPPAA